jgi:hypothetical protein
MSWDECTLSVEALRSGVLVLLIRREPCGMVSLRWVQCRELDQCRTPLVFLAVSAFRPRGVPGPTSKLSLRVPAQMGRRETEHKGGKQ